jgi:hypothetical protein
MNHGKEKQLGKKFSQSLCTLYRINSLTYIPRVSDCSASVYNALGGMSTHWRCSKTQENWSRLPNFVNSLIHAKNSDVVRIAHYRCLCRNREGANLCQCRSICFIFFCWLAIMDFLNLLLGQMLHNAYFARFVLWRRQLNPPRVAWNVN